jgi:hypothetical protein
MLMGVPTWLNVVLGITYLICTIWALFAWETTKSTIKALWKKKGGEE